MHHPSEALAQYAACTIVTACILAFLFPHSGCILIIVIMRAAVCKIEVHIHESVQNLYHILPLLKFVHTIFTTN